ncbi:MAG: RusA family crossover junction endodeoxyribonuclease [Saprospiraceae bacterium]|nr:RusA family crossover junction endodeoxyribonuclease [Saprospiraceae bacterium]
MESKSRCGSKKRIPDGTELITEDVTFQVTYYYEHESPDVDNIIKPMQDALVGLVYVDDKQVVETSSRRRDLNGAYKIRGASPIVVEGFVNGNDFLHVIVKSHIITQEL